MASAALVPWSALQALGAATLLAAAPAWLQPVRGLALGALGTAKVVALAGGVWGLQVARRVRVRGPRAVARQRPDRRQHAVCVWPTHWILVLLLWPVWRGPAQALGRAMAMGAFMLTALALGALWRPGWAPWWVAGWSTAALAWVSRWNTLAWQGLSPLLASAAESLPLRASMLERARRGLTLAPVLPMAGGLWAALGVSLPTGTLRPAVALVWGGVLALSLWLATAPPRADAEATASRWLLSLVLLLALSSEIVR